MSATLREPTGARLPSGSAIRKADVMLAKTDRGECLECARLADDENGLCLWCRSEQ